MSPRLRGSLVVVLLMLACGPPAPDGPVDGGRLLDASTDATTVDGSLDTGVLPRPFVVSSSPRLDEGGVYPASIVDGTGEAVTLRVTFSSAMDPALRDAELSSASGGESLSGEWDAAGTTITFVVSAPPFSGAPPLLDDTGYALDLSDLRSAAGAPPEPNLGLRASRLEFRTGTRDALLNHSCGHVAFGPYADAVASAAPSPLADRVDLPHHLYTLELPPIAGGATHGGFVRFRTAAAGTFHFFLDRFIAVALVDDEGAATPLEVRATPAACDGITHQVTFPGLSDETYVVHFGPGDAPEVRAIVEAEYTM